MDKQGLSKRMPPEERTARDVVRGRAKKVTKEKERNAIAGRQGLIINGTADDPEKIMKIKGHLEDNGYDTMMVYVDTSNPVSRERNIQRGKQGGREVPEDIRQEKWKSARDAREPLKAAFGDGKFIRVNNSEDYRTVHPDRRKEIDTEHGEIFKTVRKFATAPVQDTTWQEKEKEKRGITKFSTPKAQKFGSKPKQPAQQSEYVPNPSELEQAKRLGVQHLGGGQFGAKGAEPTHVSNGGRLTTLAEERMKGKDPCWKGYQMVGKKKKAGNEVPNCVPVDEDFESFINEGKKKKIKLFEYFEHSFVLHLESQVQQLFQQPFQ
jgi:predicted ABC-type ATPase